MPGQPSSKKTAALPKVVLYTDGACSGNPGPGGWAFLLKHPASAKVLERSGAEPQTTNNRMELTAVIEGLATLQMPSEVTLVTDSEYVGKGVSEWMANWKRNGWKRRERGKLMPVKNEDLWRRLDELLQVHRVRFEHIYGHSGHPENERCDELAVAAYQQFLGGGKP
ncbi:MAG: ribonuclease HI [Planctomycetia bacterium]|nr:ribonuclease HI [Planctomycetia bacterium]